LSTPSGTPPTVTAPTGTESPAAASVDTTAAPDRGADPLPWPDTQDIDGFPTEHEQPISVVAALRPALVQKADAQKAAERAAARVPRPVSPLVLSALAAVIAVETIVIGALVWTRPRPVTTSVTVEAADPGAQVLLDGQPAGVTPLRLDLNGQPRSLRVVAPPPAPARGRSAATTPGRIDVSSDPPGARVTIDGTRHGVTPLMAAIDPGQHTIVVTNGSSTTTRTVNVAAGATASIMAALSAPGVQAGWLTISVPVELQVREGGSLIGTTAADRLMLSSGHHDLELSSAALGFRTTASVDVQAGKTTTTKVAVPSGTLFVNAVPWANVFLDGQPVGTTPLGNLTVPIGSHEIVWRHPQLGERRQTAVVTTRGPVRVSVDLSK
jgi:hypothetical protein